MGRKPCCSKVGLNRGAWTIVEDKILIEYIKINGEGKWRNLPQEAGLKRCGKSCRLRWLNYLRPDIKRGNISADEEDLIIRLHKLLGNRWSLIAGRLPGRTDNEIKNYWNTTLLKKMQSQPNRVSRTQKKMNAKSSKKKNAKQDETKYIESENKQKESTSEIDTHDRTSLDVRNPTSDEVLEFDFSDILDLLNDTNDFNDFSPSSNISPFSSEEMLKGWDLRNYIPENLATNHEYFDLFDLDTNWLA